METAATIPAAIELKPRTLVGLMLSAVVATAAVTWGIVVAVDSGSDDHRVSDVQTNEEVLARLTPSAAEYVRGIMALTPAQLAAGFGSGGPVSSSAPTTADILVGLSPEVREYVEGLEALTPEELAAGFGRTS